MLYVGLQLATTLHTDGGGDGYGVEKRPGKRPLQLRFVRVVVAVPALVLHRGTHLVLERPQYVLDTGGEVVTLGGQGDGGAGRSAGYALVPSVVTTRLTQRPPRLGQVRRQSPDVVDHPAAVAHHLIQSSDMLS